MFKGGIFGLGESISLGYTNDFEKNINIEDKTAFYQGKMIGNYIAGALSEGGKGGGITLTLSGAGSAVGVPVYGYSVAVQGYSAYALTKNSVLMATSTGGDENKTDTNKGKENNKTNNYTFPNKNEISKKLNTTVDDFHSNIKDQIKKEFKTELKAIGSTNPDIGYSKTGTIVLKNPQTGKTIDTGIPLDYYKK